MPPTDLSDQLVIVTGASRGIGHHTARAFHEAGARLVVTGRDKATLERAAGDVGERCTGYVCDQRRPDAVEAFARRVLADHGPPAVLVANAGGGFGGGRHVVDMPLEQWQQTIETNLTGTFCLCKALLPAMIELGDAGGRGDVFLIGSMSGKKGDPGAAAYAASKFGLQGFAQVLNHEVRRHNIRVMVLNPSAVNTEHEDTHPPHGPGQTLHAADLATLMVDLARLPGRTLVRDMDIWGTNPF
jgi:NAD(P)-dependent dehydrogenase (short-subunit alcohol dehydrogenase family)